MTVRPGVERRVTPWKPVWWPDARVAAVRIWQEFDGRHWYQLHEWRLLDGTCEPDGAGWINGIRGWSANASPTTERAPGAPEPLTPEELAYLAERNDPLAASILRKLQTALV